MKKLILGLISAFAVATVASAAVPVKKEGQTFVEIAPYQSSFILQQLNTGFVQEDGKIVGLAVDTTHLRKAVDVDTFKLLVTENEGGTAYLNTDVVTALRIQAQKYDFERTDGLNQRVKWSELTNSHQNDLMWSAFKIFAPFGAFLVFLIFLSTLYVFRLNKQLEASNKQFEKLNNTLANRPAA